MQNEFRLVKDDYSKIENAFADDLFDRKELAEKLTIYISKLRIGATLTIDAEWGSGKTWFVQNWKNYLEDNNYNVIYLDAFTNDYLEDPFLVIAAEIATKLDKAIDANKTLVHKFKKATAIMQQGLLTIAPTVIASMISFAITGGVIPLIKLDSEKITDKLDETVDKITDKIGDKITDVIQNKIETYEEEQNSLLTFKNTLMELAKSLEQPLVFIIDELDRCRPDFAIRLIERIKHFFDIPNIVFILAINKSQLSESINSFYGFKTTNHYLEKFIDFNIKLPISNNYEYQNIINTYIRNYGLTISDPTSIETLFKFFQPNARQAIKILQKINFLNINSHLKSTYACLHMLVQDLSLMTNKDDELHVVKIFFEKAKYYYSTRVRFRKLDIADNDIDTQVMDKLTNLSDEIINIAWLYKLNFIDKANPKDIAQFKNELSPKDISLNLIKDWDDFINSGFIFDNI